MATLSEDISLSVARMLFEQVIRAVDYGSDLAQDLTKLAGEEISYGSDSLKKLADIIRKNKDNETLKKLIDGSGEISLGQMDELMELCNIRPGTIKIFDKDVDRFEQMLNRDGVLYAKVDIKEDNCKMYVYIDNEIEKVRKAASVIYAETGLVTELPADVFMEAGNPSQVKEIAGLDNVELELFRYYASKKNILFTVIPGNNNNTIVVNTSGDEKYTSIQKSNAVQRTMTEVGWALTGANGARVREQIEYRLAGRTKMLQSIDDAQKELFIVSKNNPSEFVHISYDEFEQYKAGKVINKFEKRENNIEEYRDECMKACESISLPVILSAEEYNRGVTIESLMDKKTTDIFDSSFNEVIEAYSMNEMVRLVQRGLKDKQNKAEEARRKEKLDKEHKRISDAEAKMSLDDESNSRIDPWNESVSYNDFAVYENIADDEERAARESQFDHFKDAAFYSNKNFEVVDHVLEGNIAVIIERAEQKRREREAAAARVREAVIEREKEATKEKENETVKIKIKKPINR